MKCKTKVSYLGNLTGTKKNGAEWNAIKVQDDKLDQFMIFGDKAKDYLGSTLGDELELEINIVNKMNYVTKKNEISLNF